MANCSKEEVLAMNWNDIFMYVFGRLSFCGLDMGFWVSLAAVIVIVIAMNVVFWGLKPKEAAKI